MRYQMFGALRPVRKGEYDLSVDGFDLRVGAPERTRRGKKLFVLSEEAMRDIESFIGELGIVIRNEAADRAIEYLFEKLSHFRGPNGTVALVVTALCGWDWSEVRLAFSDEVTDKLEIPS
ncbi:MAG: hypothetical protein HGA31_00280 [Candidatus Moranbacteria bacterium]|nr:hypothetical protein [Candidatus Moranbacteria bacterium]